MSLSELTSPIFSEESLNENGNEGETKSPFFTYSTKNSTESENAKMFAHQQITNNSSVLGKSKSYLSNLRPENFSNVSKDQLEMLSENFANTTLGENQLQDELKVLMSKFRNGCELRQKYIEISLQRVEDNPSSKKDWKIYPPPPPPHWSPIENPSGSEDSKFSYEQCEIPDQHEFEFKMENGVFKVYNNQQDMTEKKAAYSVPTIKEHYKDLEVILDLISDGPAKSFAYRRLQYLESKFKLFTLLNEYQELAASKSVSHRDFYNVRKVDTHIHHSACMNQKHLLRFIKSKLKKCPEDVVIYRDGKYLTLAQVFESLGLTAYDLSIDTLDMHAHKDSFHRFDKFNLKYNPIGESRLREIFLKTDNHVKGKYLAELTKEVVGDLEASKYQMAEYRLSIYGRSLDEWDRLAAWVIDNELVFHNVRWLIQFPRLYNVYKTNGNVKSFEDLLINVFQPLYEVTKDPKSHPKLHVFLQRVVGFDSVDDESKSEKRVHHKYPTPDMWNTKYNPPYSYYLYFMYANMVSLNRWRQARNFNTFVLRPHAGEAGDTDHLASAFLTSQGINHGILLRKVPVLQYLYYLEQVPLAMSPLSNNALFLNYERNPFYTYFQRGLNVSLSTDDPLQFHFTKEPLIEEYSVAAQIWKLSPTDMCEISRNSVLQSGFELQIKERWLGENCHTPGPKGNHMRKTNVPDLRVIYRHETWVDEINLVYYYKTVDTLKNGYIQPINDILGDPRPAYDLTFQRTHSPNLIHPTTHHDTNLGKDTAILAPNLIPSPNQAMLRKLAMYQDSQFDDDEDM